MTKLISKSAKMTQFGRISLVLLSMHVIWAGKSNILSIPAILAHLEINLVIISKSIGPILSFLLL